MAAKNDVTGASLITRAATSAYRDNYDAVFRKPSAVEAFEMLDKTADAIRNTLQETYDMLDGHTTVTDVRQEDNNLIVTVQRHVKG